MQPCHFDSERRAERLAAVLTLAERPGTDGEAEAAVQAAARILAADPAYFRERLVGLKQPQADPPSPACPDDNQYPTHTWREALRMVLARSHQLNDWEQNFARSIQHRRRISTKQAAVLHRIAGRRGCNWRAPA